MLSLLRLLNGISMTKSGKIKSKSDKLTKFFLDFADDGRGLHTLTEGTDKTQRPP